MVRRGLLLVAAVVLTACGAGPTAAPAPPSSSTASPDRSTGESTSESTSEATASPAIPSPSAPTPAAPSRSPSDRPDPRWQFFTDDHAWHTSPWFRGAHRVMIGYGCNSAPWYSHDDRCPGRQGFHHGIDVAMPCGTPLYSAVDGVVADPSSSGSPGSAYGVHPFRIRTGGHDVLIGHTVHVFVRPGQAVHRGQRIALAGDSGAPDGCHLHFEVRRAGGGLSTAIDPATLLALG